MTSWPPVYHRKGICVEGNGLAVDLARGVVVVSGCEDMQLYVYSLKDGTLIRSFGGQGSDPCEFNWDEAGLCLTCRGTLLVAECDNQRLQEINIDFGGHVRFVGERVLEKPDYVDCNAAVIAVSETERHCVTLLSWTDGSLLTRFGSEGSGDGQLGYCRGLRLLADGTGVVVADQDNDRICVFSTSGAFIRSLAAGKCPNDVVEVDGGASFIVTNYTDGVLTKVPADGSGGKGVPFGCNGNGDGEFDWPVTLAVVPDAGEHGDVELVVLDSHNNRFQVLRATPTEAGYVGFA